MTRHAMRLSYVLAFFSLLFVWTQAATPVDTSPTPAARSLPPALHSISNSGNVNNVSLPASITDFKPEQWFNPTNGDGVDTDNGTLNWKGRTFDLGSSRIFRARFERYLNIASADQEKLKTYQAQLTEVASLLSPLPAMDGSNADSNVEKAYRILYEAAKYPGDAGTSKSLAHMIFNSWRLRAEIRADGRQLSQLNDAADRKSNDAQNHASMGAMPGLNGPGRTVTSADFSSDLRLGRNDSQLGKVLADALPAKIEFAKLGFQSQIVYFLLQRRYEHARIACSFYRVIFKGSAQELKAGQSALAAFLPQSDMVYSVEAVERLANEAIDDVTGTMEVIHTAIEEKDLNNATERLEETFHLGEFLPAVTRFPEAERLRIRDYYRLLREARDLANLKDYTRLLVTSARLRDLAADYDHTKVESQAQSAMQASNLALAGAQLEIGRQNLSEGQKLLREAASLWPLNPALASLTLTISEQSDTALQATRKFDEAIAHEDLRSIFDNRHELGVGLFKDPVRSTRLKTVLDQVAQTDLLLGQAKILTRQGNPYAAWEMVLQSEMISPKDREVFTLKSSLLTPAVDFARALDEARNAEERTQWSSSFVLYQKALDLNPVSQLARDGQARITPKFLEAASRN